MSTHTHKKKKTHTHTHVQINKQSCSTHSNYGGRGSKRGKNQPIQLIKQAKEGDGGGFHREGVQIARYYLTYDHNK